MKQRPQYLLVLEERLEKGDQLCQQATGDDLKRLNQFWLNLLAEYERKYREWKEEPNTGEL